MQYYLHSFAESVKEFLMLLRNSKKGIYTLITEIQPSIVEYIREFKDFDLLFIFSVMGDRPIISTVSFLCPMKIENFVFRGRKAPVMIEACIPKDAKLVYKTGEWFELYEKDNKLLSSLNFYTLYDYDFKRDLPSIQDYIERKYKNYKFFDTYEKFCTCGDLFGEDIDCDDLKDIRVINHMRHISKLEADSRRVACLNFWYMKDGSVVLKAHISVKYPSIMEIIAENYGIKDDIKFKFILFVDVDEYMKNTEELKYTWFGAYFYEDYIELYDEDGALMELEKQIPNILKNMRIPISKDYDD